MGISRCPVDWRARTRISAAVPTALRPLLSVLEPEEMVVKHIRGRGSWPDPIAASRRKGLVLRCPLALAGGDCADRAGCGRTPLATRSKTPPRALSEVLTGASNILAAKDYFGINLVLNWLTSWGQSFPSCNSSAEPGFSARHNRGALDRRQSRRGIQTAA